MYCRELIFLFDNLWEIRATTAKHLLTALLLTGKHAPNVIIEFMDRIRLDPLDFLPITKSKILWILDEALQLLCEKGINEREVKEKIANEIQYFTNI